MKKSARIQSAIDILGKVEKSHIPMDSTIRDYMSYRRYIGSKDRADIVERVYQVIRSYGRLNWWMEHLELEKTARWRLILDLLLNDGISLRQLDELFNSEKYAPEKLNAEEASQVAKLRGKTIVHEDMPLAVQVECPEWAELKLRRRFGENFKSELEAMILPASLDLRVNTVKGNVEKAQEMLAAQEVKTESTPYSPVGLRAEGKAFLSVTKAFQKGLVEIQDEGSQLIALISGAKPGMRVLDYCAGAGGKTLGIAAMMENKGNIVAMDLDSKRLEKGRKRFSKAGIHNVELRSLQDEKNRKWLRRQKGEMDVVLVDVPCSSSGTWRRNPDLRWRQYGPSLEEIKVMQTDILERVSDKVKIGGRLIYATCSLFPEENQDQIEAFLKTHDNFSLLPLEECWPENIGQYPCDGMYLQLTPKNHKTDGFFAAVLTRHT